MAFSLFQVSCGELPFLFPSHSVYTSRGKVGESSCEVVVLSQLVLVELEVLLPYVPQVKVLVVVVRLLEFRLVDQ